MWKVDFTISYSTQKLLSKLPKIIDNYMRRYAASAEKGSKEAIDKGILINSIAPKTGGGKLKGLEPTTIRMRKEAGITGTKPLYETGTFYRSIKSTPKGLQMLAYGYKHQKGFPNPVKGWKPIPPRPFIGASKKETVSAFTKFKKDMREGFSKTGSLFKMVNK